MKLYGKQWTRRELEERFGRIDQIGGLRRVQSVEGPEAGVEQVLVRTGAGLSYTVLPSRGLDIGLAEFGGAALSWISPNDLSHPAYYDDRGLGWLRTAAGGLLMSCGLTQVGSPNEDNNQSLGQHGRLHHTPARQVSAQAGWEGDEYRMVVRGQVEETSIAGDCLRLSRTITSTLGQNSLTIADEVENLGFQPSPHMLLYHFNFGFPLIREDTQLSLPDGKVRGREKDLPLDGRTTWQAPQAGYQERVYYYEELQADPDGFSQAAIHTPHFPLPGFPTGCPLTLRLRWDSRSLPNLVQWKMPGQGMHVLGLEPANCHVEGRAAERRAGTLQMLQPGELRKYHLEIALLEE